MTIKKPLFAIALLALALTACSGGEKEATAEGHGEGEAAKSSSAGLPAGHIEAGQKLASTKQGPNGQACAECHGADGNKPNAETVPHLAGQYADYIEHALLAYRKGDRQNDLMGPQAKELTDQQIADLAAYFHSQEAQIHDLHNAE